MYYTGDTKLVSEGLRGAISGSVRVKCTCICIVSGFGVHVCLWRWSTECVKAIK